MPTIYSIIMNAFSLFSKGHDITLTPRAINPIKRAASAEMRHAAKQTSLIIGDFIIKRTPFYIRGKNNTMLIFTIKQGENANDKKNN